MHPARLLLLLFVALMARAVVAQEIVLRRLDEQRGLPSDCVLDLFIDHENLLWVATNKGLFRYDGFQFEHIGQGTGLDEVNVVDMWEDVQHGCMLLSGYGERVFICRGTQVRELQHANRALPLGTAGCIANWAPLPNGRLRANHRQFPRSYEVDTATFSITFTNAPDADEHARVELRADAFDVQLTGPAGPKDDPIDSVLLPDLGVRLAIPVRYGKDGSPRLPIVGRLPEGGYYLAHYEVLHVLDGSGVSRSIPFDGRVLGVCVDRSGLRWVRAFGQGVHCFDAQWRECSIGSPFLMGTHVTDCVQDAAGGLWFSTLDRGLFYCATVDVRMFRAETELATPWASGIEVADRSSIYVGGADGLVFRCNTSGRVTPLRNVSGWKGVREVHRFKVLQDSTVLVGSAAYRIEPSQQLTIEARTLPSKQTLFNDLEQLDNGRFLQADNVGLRLLGTKEAGGDSSLLRGPRCTGLYRIGTGLLFATTSTDGLLYTDLRRVWKDTTGGPLLRCAMNDIEGLGDSLWLATHQGLVLRTRNAAQLIDLPGPVPHPRVRALAVQKGRYLLAATLDGLFRLDLRSPSHIERFGRAQGLPTETITDVTASEDIIWCIAGPDVCFFRPDHLKSADPRTPLRIIEVQGWKGNQVIGSGSEFGHAVDHVQVHLRGVNYARFGNAAFRYRLSTSDAWVESALPEVDLLGLGPGNHKVEVQAADAIGGWGESVYADWSIRPAWWQRPATQVAAVLLLLFLVGASVLRFRERRQREARLAAEVERYHHKALIAQMEPHFLYNALTSIQGFITRGDTLSSSRYLAKFAKLMRGLLNAAHNERIPIGEEVGILENYCALEALRTEPPFAYNITLENGVDANTMAIPSFFVQPYVENAIRHGLRQLRGERAGRLSVNFRKEGDDVLCCVVEDNGVGRAAAGAKTGHGGGWRSMGTSINAERLRLLNSLRSREADTGVKTEDLVDEQGRASGTRVTLRIPVSLSDGNDGSKQNTTTP